MNAPSSCRIKQARQAPGTGTGTGGREQEPGICCQFLNWYKVLWYLQALFQHHTLTAFYHVSADEAERRRHLLLHM